MAEPENPIVKASTAKRSLGMSAPGTFDPRSPSLT
jgi:hypothetical protein